MTSLGFLRFKVFLVYISNVYDNLPTDEVAHARRSATTSSRPAPTSRPPRPPRSPRRRRAAPDELAGLVAQAAAAGPGAARRGRARSTSPTPTRPSSSGGPCWAALRLEERYVPLDGLDIYDLAPGDQRRAAAPAAGVRRRRADARQQRRRRQLRREPAAAAPLRQADLPRHLRHRRRAYRTGFRGPGKYDGSVVNWVNGPLLAHIGAAHGLRRRASRRSAPRAAATSSR